jgi:hypothetical protein
MTHDASLGWVEGWYEENLGSPLKSAYSGAHPLCRPILVIMRSSRLLECFTIDKKNVK